MNQNIVVVEGDRDRILLESLLRSMSNQHGLRVIAAGGYSAADSLARSILIRGIANVALVVDADSIDPRAIDERRGFLNQSLGEVPTHSKWRVFVIAPEVEVLLFFDRSILERFVGHEVSETDLVRGHYEPKKVLADLMRNGKHPTSFEQAFAGLDLSAIREAPEVKELFRFVRSSNGTSTPSRKIR